MSVPASPGIGPVQDLAAAAHAPAGRVRRGVLSWLPFALPAAAELVIGGYQLGGPSLWRDEGYTVEVAMRPAGRIIAMLTRQDAVHGLYYLIMHVVQAAAGTSAVALRLPSLLAACGAAGLTGALGTRLARETRLPYPATIGTLAGLALAALPLTTWYAQDARPYALTTLCAVAATWLLIIAASGRGWRAWAAYSVVVSLLGWMSIFGLLLVPAHGLSLLMAGRSAGTGVTGQRLARCWLIAVAGAGVLAAPLMVLVARQAHEYNWIHRPGAGKVVALVADFAGAPALLPAVLLLALCCVLIELGLHRRPGWTTAALALPWLVLPPAVLLAVSLVHPAYVERYVMFCTPAVALLAAAGLGWLIRLAMPADATTLRRVVSLALAGVLLAGSAALLAGPQLAIRRTSQRPDNLRRVAAIVAAREQPGDAVVYLPWSARVVGLTYPDPFQGLRDVGQAVSPTASDTLTGRPVSTRVLVARLATAGRVWVIRWAGHSVPAHLRMGAQEVFGMLRPIAIWRVGSVLLGLYSVQSR
jgi:mannosyltransferase